MSCQAVSKFLTQYHLTHRIVRKPGSGRHSKITDAVLRAVEAKMQFDDANKHNHYDNCNKY